MWRRVVLTGTLTAVALLAGLTLHRRGSLKAVQNGAPDLSVGNLLIAKPELADPNFAQSVVLIVNYDTEKGAVGLILNRRTKVLLSKVLPNVKGAKDDPVYEGGPVETESAQALLLTHDKPEGATHILGDVYASGSKDIIEKLVGTGASPSEFRLYAGYAGWGPGQLEREITVGGWSVLRANTRIIFDDDPDSLWQRLQHAAETRIARASEKRRYWPPAVDVAEPAPRFPRLG